MSLFSGRPCGYTAKPKVDLWRRAVCPSFQRRLGSSFFSSLGKSWMTRGSCRVFVGSTPLFAPQSQPAVE